MKYWYLKEGDILGPWTAEEIAKDNLFTADSLVCPQDKAEIAEFWKAASSYLDDFASFLTQEGEAELEIPTEVFLDDIPLEDETEESKEPKENKQAPQEPKQDIIEPKPEPLPQDNKPADDTEKEVEIQPVQEEKNPFESDRPQIAPNIEDTISSHVIAPRLDADGDTLLEDIPAKAILSEEEEQDEILQDKDFISSSSLASEDTLEDTPILNIFERTQEQQKTKELKDISENIYDTYGADKPEEPAIKIKALPEDQPERQEQIKKNNKIYLLLIVMFVLVAVALFLAAFGSNNEKSSASAASNKQQNYVPSVKKQNTSKKVKQEQTALTQEEAPVNSAALVNTMQTDSLQRDKALAKVKNYILPGGKTIEDFLTEKYNAYQTSWTADVLSGNNYFVHFKASKIRQEPMVYSFSIDLDKNEINGLNNLGMDLLLKGE